MFDHALSGSAADALREMASEAIEVGRSGVMPLDDAVTTIPASDYTDEGRYRLELDRIFRRLPLMLATSAELPLPGDFKTIDVVGAAVLISRQQDGTLGAFRNSCMHRGMKVATEAAGSARRFVCPYHGWTYGQDGGLIGVAAPADFGVVDKACYSLTHLRCFESAGFIWVILDPDTTLEISDFLSGYDALLNSFEFSNWHLLGTSQIHGPNWKAAFDGYLDFYHVAVLHKDTIGKGLGNRALYYAWGPHQRVVAPVRDFARYDGSDPSTWPQSLLTSGVWTIFPHVSLTSFDSSAVGGRMVMISLLFPSDIVNESRTEQIFMLDHLPVGDELDQAQKLMKMLSYVVEVEDYETVRQVHRAMSAGMIDRVTFGRNEGGSRRFHAWVDRLIAAADEELPGMFQVRPPATA